ncbi:MAG: hypothetical protein LBU38_02925 [Propionibacteriaceae bacterium]|jgi:hypothetical protein|nr:hypothetical protein [Propionibacteriaceae bacterium]
MFYEQDCDQVGLVDPVGLLTKLAKTVPEVASGVTGERIIYPSMVAGEGALRHLRGRLLGSRAARIPKRHRLLVLPRARDATSGNQRRWRG